MNWLKGEHRITIPEKDFFFFSVKKIKMKLE